MGVMKFFSALVLVVSCFLGPVIANDRQIASAKQESSQVKVYDEKGNFMFSRSGELVGYTSTTITIKDGSQNKTYDNKGNFKFSR